MTAGTNSRAIDCGLLDRLLAEETASFARLHPRSAALAAPARRHLLGGVPMPWMTRLPGGFPLFFEQAAGARITDVDGIEYVDFCLGDTGAMAGHALPEVADAIAAQARRGITTMMPNEDAIWVGAELASRFGLPVWQLAMTATDANRFVLRFARALTGRAKVVVMDWCYHGTVDETLAVLSPDGRPASRTGAIGAPVPVEQTTRVVPFNDVPALAAALAHGDVAAVLMEPALTNIGIVLPEPGYLDEVRRLTREAGVLLVIDETHTLCAGPGGCTRAWGLDPDLFVIGKAIGGGMPVAAYGMTDAVAARLEALVSGSAIDVSGVGGTLAGNALATAAVRATLSSSLRAGDFEHMIPLAAAWTDGVRRGFESVGFDWHVQQLGARAEYWFCHPPRNGAEAAAAVDDALDRFMHLWAINRGVLLTPFHNMALFSPHHRLADVERHEDVFTAACTALTP
jgi:glutamate-1-semialdehyde 2,1-aminomutase